jgi:hypothetical protein
VGVRGKPRGGQGRDAGPDGEVGHQVEHSSIPTPRARLGSLAGAVRNGRAGRAVLRAISLRRRP